MPRASKNHAVGMAAYGVAPVRCSLDNVLSMRQVKPGSMFHVKHSF